MKDKEIFTIHVWVNGLKIPLRIRREEEEIYRNAEKLVKNHIKTYREQMGQSSMEEILTISAYHIAVIATKIAHSKEIHPLVKKIEELNELLDEKEQQPITKK